MAEFFALLKNFIGFLRESKNSKFMKSSKGRFLFSFVSIILALILALIKNPSLLQNLFNDEKDDLVFHCKAPSRSKYNNIGEFKKILRSEAKRKEAQKRQDLSFDIKNYSSFDLKRSN